MTKLTKIMIDVFGISEAAINDDLDLREMESWDSMNHMLLITSIEQTFECEFSGDDIAQMLTLTSIKQILNREGVREI